MLNEWLRHELPGGRQIDLPESRAASFLKLARAIHTQLIFQDMAHLFPKAVAPLENGHWAKVKLIAFRKKDESEKKSFVWY